MGKSLAFSPRQHLSFHSQLFFLILLLSPSLSHSLLCPLPSLYFSLSLFLLSLSLVCLSVNLKTTATMIACLHHKTKTSTSHPVCPILSLPISSHPVQSSPIPSHTIRSNPVPSHPIPSGPIQSYPIPSHPSPSHPFPYNPTLSHLPPNPNPNPVPAVTNARVIAA